CTHPEQQRLIADENATAIGLFASRDIAQEGRFAGAVGPDDADHLALPGDEVDSAKRTNSRLPPASEHRIADAAQSLGPLTGIVGIHGVADLDVLRDYIGVVDLSFCHSSPPLARRTGSRG